MRLGENNRPLASTIDQIISHHYFMDRVSALVTEKTESYLNQTEGLSENKYLMAENHMVSDLGDIICRTIQTNLKKVVNGEFVSVSRDIMKMKQEMYDFIEQQSKLTSNLRKELNRGLEQVKRKSMPDTINSLAQNRASHRFSRQHGKEQEKRYKFTDLEEMKRSIEQVRELVQKGQNLTALTDQLNEFKIETKVAIESMKHQIKKLSTDMGKGEQKYRWVNPNLKDSIDQVVKRTVKSQLTVYGSYVQEVSSLKNSIQNIEQEINQQENKHHDYFTNQLKSVWKVINNLRDVQEEMAHHVKFSIDNVM